MAECHKLIHAPVSNAVNTIYRTRANLFSPLSTFYAHLFLSLLHLFDQNIHTLDLLWRTLINSQSESDIWSNFVLSFQH